MPRGPRPPPAISACPPARARPCAPAPRCCSPPATRGAARASPAPPRATPPPVGNALDAARAQAAHRRPRRLIADAPRRPSRRARRPRACATRPPASCAAAAAASPARAAGAAAPRPASTPSPTASARSPPCSPPGDTNRRIAAQLHLSTKTVETHIAHIFGKLGVRSRAAVATALVARVDSASWPASRSSRSIPGRRPTDEARHPGDGLQRPGRVRQRGRGQPLLPAAQASRATGSCASTGACRAAGVHRRRAAPAPARGRPAVRGDVRPGRRLRGRLRLREPVHAARST